MISDRSSHINHPYNGRYPIPDGTRTLIVGTAPPPRFFASPPCMKGDDFHFFYGSGWNYMWEWLPIAFGEPNALTKKMSSEECVSEAIRLLKSKNIWMHDTLTRVTRNQNMERMASDRSIRTPASNDFSDFKTIFSTHTKLVTIAATSQQAYKYLQTAMKLQGLASSNGYAELAAWSKSQPSNSAADETSFKIEKHVRPISKFDFEGRTLSIYLLPSPSGRYSNSGKLSAEIYRRVLTDEIPSKT